MLKKYKNIPLYLLLITTFAPASIEKFAGGGTPEWFLKQFSGSLLDVFPGSLPISFYLIALMEAVSAILLLLSLAKQEFFPERDKPILEMGLLLSQITFVSLAFGQRITHQFDGAFFLFAYAAFTFLTGNLALKKDSHA